jgi:pyridoxal phosphate enzyme (YggS family)
MLTTPHFSVRNLESVRQRVDSAARAAGRDPSSVRLVAVSKKQPAEAVRAAAAAGQAEFGENYVQDALPKIATLNDLPLVWHFIGRIQSNKTRDIAEAFQWVHTVDRKIIADRLNAQRPHHAGPLDVLLQVRLRAEESKGGIEPASLPALADAVAALPRLRLRGLMCLPPPCRDPTEQRVPFAELRALLVDLNQRGHTLDTLSMGMSDDLEAAIAEGATIVRIGTAIFGPRE